VKVLLAEDDPITARVLEQFLRDWGYEVLVTRTGTEAWELLQKPGAPSLVISDWMMPHMDGLELCRKIRKREDSHYVYFIILTSKGRREDLVEGLEAGADDFVIKPFDSQELRYRMKTGERIIRLEERIVQMADTDPLTGILNRRAFMLRMEGELNRCIRQNNPLSLVLSDIDHFKAVNDNYGHQAGDLVLQQFANRMSLCFRAYDLIGRYGGEEFIVCLPQTDADRAALAAERLRQEVERMAVDLPYHGKTIKITASFGVSCLHPDTHEKAESVIRRADDALYKSKAEGRNRVCLNAELGARNAERGGKQ
jgi:two-component system chemotaxis response regulator CheY